jgi:hypothetical protein
LGACQATFIAQRASTESCRAKSIWHDAKRVAYYRVLQRRILLGIPLYRSFAVRRSISGILLVCAAPAFWACCDSLFADDVPSVDQPSAKKTEGATRRIRSSDKAVVQDVVYGLEEEESRLYLTSQALDAADQKAKRIELEFTVPEGGRVIEMSLTRFSSKNLMAVLKIAQGKEFDFHCLGFIASSDGHVRDGFRLLKQKFFTTQEDLKILATDGRHYSASLFIVLGDMEYDPSKEVMVSTGTFFFSGCPWTPGDGQLLPFRVESVARKDE